MNIIERQTEIFALLSSPVAIRVINLLLYQRQVNVTDLTKTIQMVDQSGVSRILRKLRTMDLANFEKSGNVHLYSLTAQGQSIFEQHLSTLLIEDVYQEDRDKLDKLLT